MLDSFCSGKEVDIVVLVLVFALLVVSIGKGGGTLLAEAFKKLLGREKVAVNVGVPMNSKKSECPKALIDPRLCPDHKAEQERSLRNEKEIEKLWGEYSALAKDIALGLEKLNKQNAQSFAMLHANQLKLLVGLVKSGVLDPKYVPTDVGKPIFDE